MMQHEPRLMVTTKVHRDEENEALRHDAMAHRHAANVQLRKPSRSIHVRNSST
jgi:hypothetical protein